MAFKVVVTRVIDYPYWDELIARIGAEFVREHCPTDDEVIAAARDAGALINVVGPCSRKVIDNLPRLRLIVQMGIGYDTIDVDTATEAGVIVCNNPDYCVEEVSDHAMALLLACVREITQLNNLVKQGRWLEGRNKAQPKFKLRGQTLGLVGFGRIARALVPKARGFGLRIIAHDPYVSKTAGEEYDVEFVSLDKLLRESDYVSAHTPLTMENQHMFTLESFKKMKPTAFFINTARGGLIDEHALYTAVNEGFIAGAGLDVLETEPPEADNPLLKLDNVIITPHQAQASVTAVEQLMRRPMEDVVRVLEGHWPHGFVNPSVKEKYMRRFGTMVD